MRSPLKSYLLLHCKMESISLVEFSPNEENRLWQLRSETILSSLEKNFSEEITTQFRKIRTSWKLKETKLHCLLPANLLFLKQTTLKIPLNLHNALPIIAQLEAEQVVPFPLHEVIWDYQILKTPDPTFPESESVNVIYAAIKKTVIQPLCDAVENAGFTIETINAPPAALISAINFLEHKNNSSFAGSFFQELQTTPLIPNDINLLPASSMAKRKRHEQLPYFAAIGALFFLILLTSSFFLSNATKRNSAATAQTKLLLRQKKEALAALDENLTIAESHKKNITQLTGLIKLSHSWPMLLEEVQQHLPSRYLWITKLSPLIDAKNKNAITALAIDGLYLENSNGAQVVDNFVAELKKSEFFAIDKNSSSNTIIHRATPDGRAYAYPFSLRLPLSKPIP